MSDISSGNDSEDDVSLFISNDPYCNKGMNEVDTNSLVKSIDVGTTVVDWER
jgi:hypothetical protein